MGRRARLPPSREAPADHDAAFTLVQLVLALAGLVFASVVLPAWLAIRVNQARVARAGREAAAIADAVRLFEADNGFLPLWRRVRAGGPGGETDRLDVLAGSGEMPAVAESAGRIWLSDRSASLADQLALNAPGHAAGDSRGGRGRAGPYLSSVRPDPWGNRYLVVARPGARGAACVVSAGPNGIVETDPDDLSDPDGARGDDVVVGLETRRMRSEK